MLPKLRSHKEYVDFVDNNLKGIQIPKAHKNVVKKLKLLDLVPLRLLCLPLYKKGFGRPGYAPEDLMRSLIAMVLCGIYSISIWVEDYLKDENGFYAIISGFLPSDTPCVGCLYGFISRILKLPEYCKKNYIRPKREKLTRNQKKQLKDDKDKVSKKHIKILAKLADRFQKMEASSQEAYIPDAEKMVNSILELCCVNESQARGLLNKEHLNISADGTKLKAYANRYGKKICNCESPNCDCPRFFNSPDASLGYDSYHEVYVYGYNFYQISSWSFDNKYELPTYLSMVTGSRHDSVPGMYAMQRSIRGMGYVIENGCFDSAHDADARASNGIWHIKPFIPLNPRNEGNTSNLSVSIISPDGVPLCQAGYQMHYCGHEGDRDRIKWRCPIKATKKNASLECEFLSGCSPSSYGRVIHTHSEDNLRLHPPVVRNTQAWQDVYDHRTSAERVFKREKNDFHLSSFRTRSKERLLFYALLTAMAVHIDAWFRQDETKAKEAEAA